MFSCKTVFGRPIVVVIIFYAFLTSCTKSSDVKQQNNNSNTNAVPNSMTVSYFGEVPRIYYNFIRNSSANEYTIVCRDSLRNPTSPNTRYFLTSTTKTYFTSSANPQRVSKIRYRQFQRTDSEAPLPGLNYDLEFDFNDNTTNYPYQMIVKEYGDTAGNNVISQSVIIPRPWYGSWAEGGLDIFNNTWTEPLRTPTGGFDTDVAIFMQYTDSNYEIQTRYPVNDFSLFGFTGPTPNYTSAEYGLYNFNTDKNMKTMAWSAMSDNSGDSVALYAKDRLDFKYDQSQPQIESLFNIVDNTNIWITLYLERICSYASGAFNQYGTTSSYNVIDTYVSDPSVYYENVCSSYTDSTFTFTHDWDPWQDMWLPTVTHFNAVNTYTNNIFKDSIGRISRLTKTDQTGTELREIKVGY
jgi:hypothetical protein